MEANSMDFFLIDRNLNTEEDSSDIKSFITRDNDEEKCNEEIEEAEEIEEPVCNGSNNSKIINQIK